MSTALKLTIIIIAMLTSCKCEESVKINSCELKEYSVFGGKIPTTINLNDYSILCSMWSERPNFVHIIRADAMGNVVQLHLNPCYPVKASDLQRISKLKSLKVVIDAYCSDITRDDLEMFIGTTNLSSLIILGNEFKIDGLPVVLQR